MTPRVLVVSPYYPFPEDRNGLGKVLANLLVDTEHYRADCLTLFSPRDLESVSFEQGRACRFERLPFDPTSSLLRQVPAWALSRLPRAVLRFRGAFELLARRIAARAGDYDLVHMFAPELAPVLDMLPRAVLDRLIFSPVDAYSLLFERRWRSLDSLPKRLALRLEHRRYVHLEQTYYHRPLRCVFVSDSDATHVRKLNPATRTVPIPQGVDDTFFSYPPQPSRGHDLVFVGNFSYAPNRDGARFLAEQVMPALWRSAPAARLYLVGREPGRDVLALQSERVVVTGFVEDVRDHVIRGALSVCPLRFGSGVKFKVLEAMALGRVVVGSPLSFEGIGAHHDEHCWVVPENTAACWSSAVLGLLEREDDRRRIETAASRFVREGFSWEVMRRRHGELYRELAAVQLDRASS